MLIDLPPELSSPPRKHSWPSDRGQRKQPHSSKEKRTSCLGGRWWNLNALACQKQPSFHGGDANKPEIGSLHDRILERRVEEEETTRGGIVTPDTAKDKPQESEVIAAGKGKVNEKGRLLPLDVKEGDRVLFSKYAGSEIEIEVEESSSYGKTKCSASSQKREKPNNTRPKRASDRLGRLEFSNGG